MRRVRESVREFQSAVLPTDAQVERGDGVMLRQRYLPLARVGICVPGGAAAYPSTVLMTAVPAQVAGVEQLAVVAPPTPIWCLQRRFAGDLPRIGNLRSLSSRRCAGRPPCWHTASTALTRLTRSSAPGICSSRWPRSSSMAMSTSIRLPDRAKSLSWRTTRLRPSLWPPISLPRRSTRRGPVCSSPGGERVLEETSRQLERQLNELSRGEMARESLQEFGALVLVRDQDEAAKLTDWIAPEHLHIETERCGRDRREDSQRRRHLSGAEYTGCAG